MNSKIRSPRLRSAVETLAMVKTDEQRARLVEIVKHDVRRLDRLITDISDASRLDAELARAETNPVDVARLLGAISTLANETRKEQQAEIVLQVVPAGSAYDPLLAFVVLGHEFEIEPGLQESPGQCPFLRGGEYQDICARAPLRPRC